jgi:glycerol-3-phosphate acyltransferase PlsY
MELTEVPNVMGLCVLAYLLGSIPFGKIIGYFRGIDVQKVGSHNIGATNLFRAAGKVNAFLTFGLDAAKAALPVYLAMRVFEYPWQAVTLVAALAVLGSCYSVWLKMVTGSWTAGKGVSALFGVLAVIIGWSAFLALLVIWFVLIFIFITNRKMSAASLFLASSVPILYLIWPLPVLVSFWPFAFAVISWRHRENIKRIFKGREKSIELPEPLGSFFKDFSLDVFIQRYFPPKDNEEKKP